LFLDVIQKKNNLTINKKKYFIIDLKTYKNKFVGNTRRSCLINHCLIGRVVLRKDVRFSELEGLITASRLGGARDCATAALFSGPHG
jgi:hypothetical protein